MPRELFMKFDNVIGARDYHALEHFMLIETRPTLQSLDVSRQ